MKFVSLKKRIDVKIGWKEVEKVSDWGIEDESVESAVLF